MTNQLPPELFSQRPVQSDFSDRETSYLIRRFITVIVLISLVAGVVYSFWGRRPSVHDVQDIPTIVAEKNYKKRPEQPGGIDIPHQDVQVYQELDSKNADKNQEEHLLPPSESPQISSAPVAMVQPAVPLTHVESLMPDVVKTTETPGTASSQVSVNAPIALNGTSSNQLPSPIVEQAVSSSTPRELHSSAALKPASDNKADVSQSPSDIALNKSEASPLDVNSSAGSVKPHSDNKAKESNLTIEQVINNTKQVKTSLSRERAVQLASLPDQVAAEQMMSKLQVKYASSLVGVRLHLVKADLGAKGTYYRIQGPVSSEQQALDICSSLKKLNAGCILVSAR